MAQTTFSQGEEWMTDLRKKWKNAASYTIEVAEAMPEEYYEFKPTEEEMSFRRQLVHLSGNMLWLSSSYLNHGAFNRDSVANWTPTKAATLELLRQSFDTAAEALERVDVAELGKEVQFFAGPMHLRQIILLMHDHLTHHRGQAIVYLRLKGIKPPAYRGW